VRKQGWILRHAAVITVGVVHLWQLKGITVTTADGKNAVKS